VAPGRHTVPVTPPRPSAATGLSEGERRSQILDTAGDVFARSGFARTSMKDLADACGILPGSLYHHFASKDAIAVELLRRYRGQLEAVGAGKGPRSVRELSGGLSDRVLALGRQLADVAVRNRAALLLSTYDPAAGAPAELTELARIGPDRAVSTMTALLRDGKRSGLLREEVDVPLLARQLGQVMLHVALATLHAGPSTRSSADTLCLMLLKGIAPEAGNEAALDGSAAMRAALAAVHPWAGAAAEAPEDRATGLRLAARAEFARRGYEATTVRDIAAVSGLATGTVYRLVESKESLLQAIMESFYEQVSQAYAAVDAADGTVVEKLDALARVNIEVLRTFGEEYQIQQAWFRSDPPAVSTPAAALRWRAGVIRGLVERGLEDGSLGWAGSSSRLVSQCVRDLIWLPPNVAGRSGKRALQQHVRTCLLGGALTGGSR
jgi:AcrR family transcriptional regulator